MRRYLEENREARNAYKREYRKRKLATDSEYREREYNYQKVKLSERRLKNPESWLLKLARNRAKRNLLEFNIDLSDIIIPERCPICDILISLTEGRDSVPSLDRIDNTKGYVKGNVRVISGRANRLKSDISLLELERMLEYIKSNYNK